MSVLGFLPLLTSHSFEKSLCARSRACGQARTRARARTPPTADFRRNQSAAGKRSNMQMKDVSGTQSMSSHLIFSICTHGAVSLLPTAPGDLSSSCSRDMWSIRRSQPSVPSPGCDLIFGAAAGRGSWTAIKLRDNSPKKREGVLGVGLEGGMWIKKEIKNRGMMVEVQRDGKRSPPPADSCLPLHLSDQSASSAADEPFQTRSPVTDTRCPDVFFYPSIFFLFLPVLLRLRLGSNFLAIRKLTPLT